MDELIKTITIDESNLVFCGKKKIINGTLYIEIKRIMKEYADKQVKLALVDVSKSVCAQTGMPCGFPCHDGCPEYEKQKLK